MLAHVLRLYRLAGFDRLEQGCQPLLTVQDQPVGMTGRRRRRPLDRTELEPDIAAGPQHHQGARRVPKRNRRQQGSDVLVWPHPAPLELWQLSMAGADLLQQVTKEFLLNAVGVNRHVISRSALRPAH